MSTATSTVRQSAPSPAVSQHSSIHDVQADEPNLHQAAYESKEELTLQFTEYLLYGNKMEALGGCNFKSTLYCKTDQ